MQFVVHGDLLDGVVSNAFNLASDVAVCERLGWGSSPFLGSIQMADERSTGTPKHKVSDMAMSLISEEMVNDAQQAWCDGLVRIGEWMQKAAMSVLPPAIWSTSFMIMLRARHWLGKHGFPQHQAGCDLLLRRR